MKLHLPFPIAPHGLHYCLNHPSPPPSVEKLSSMKPFPGAEKAGDHCPNGQSVDVGCPRKEHDLGNGSFLQQRVRKSTISQQQPMSHAAEGKNTSALKGASRWCIIVSSTSTVLKAAFLYQITGITCPHVAFYDHHSSGYDLWDIFVPNDSFGRPHMK